MAGKAEIGKQFMEELLGKLPAAQQASVREVLSSPEAQAAYDYVGSRVSPLDEERTRLNELQTQLQTRESRLNDWHGRLETWKTTKETEYTERERKIAEREAGGGNGNQPPPKPGPTAEPSAMTKEDIEKTVGAVLAQREGGYIQYVADATRFASFHLQNFNEVLDVGLLVKHPKIGELGVQGVYELLNKERLDEMKTKAAAADREKLKQELRREILTEQPVDMPYPINGEGSPLDVLSLDADKRPKGDPVTATRMYEQLVGANQGR